MMVPRSLPSTAEMRRAFDHRDAAYDGVFFVAVRTTGVYCRPTCPARRPRPDNVEFFADGDAAARAGYRPCRRCRPQQAPGTPPAWLTPLLGAVSADPAQRWTDRDVTALGLSPARVRRWFHREHGTTFLAWARARRVSAAVDRLRDGRDVTTVAFDSGFDSTSGFHDAVRRIVGVPPSRAAAAPVLHTARVPTALGSLLAAADHGALVLLEYPEAPRMGRQLGLVARRLGSSTVEGRSAVIDRLRSELTAWLAGRRRDFDVPVRLVGTPFQVAVWQALREIPYGATWTYGEVARRVGRPAAVRAVGRAVGANPLSILVPCHRVVGADGRLTGYGGGLWRKRRLLDLERGRLA